jgi:hypothetical protein
MARQAAEAHLPGSWSPMPADIEPGALASLIADGTAEARENFGTKEWRRKPT